MPFTSVRAGFRLTLAHARLGALCLSLCLGLCLALMPMPAYAQDATVAPGTAAVITGEEAVLLRSDPGFDAGVVTPLANGTPVTVLDGPYSAADGSSWYQVDFSGQTGFVPAGHLGDGASQPAPAESAPVTDQAPVEDPAEAPVSDPGATVGVAPAVTTSDVNLRSEPDGNAAVLATVPPGAAIEVTGAAVGGYLPVVANGTFGWIAAEFVQAGASAAPTDQAVTTEPAPEPAAVTAPPETGSLVATSDANLRAEPFPEAAVIGSVPAGAGLSASGVAENGFTPVSYNGQFGWVGSELVSSGDGTAPSSASAPEAAAPRAASLISWPFRGGTWEVIQGYNNGTHQNRSSFANYHYALDWALVGGGTAGQPVYAPASGTISWIDRGSGGMLIDMGNGYGVAMFHVTYDYGLSRGQSIQAGQPVGTISGPGGEGYMSTAHVDMTLWQLAGGGTHIATPFTGQFAISGAEFPDLGGVNQHMGVRVTP